MRRRLRPIVAALAVLGLSVAFAGMAAAAPEEGTEAEETSDEDSPGEKPSDERYQRLLDQGRDAYNAKKYDEAADHYIRAAQTFPTRPQAYRNLARTYFWEKAYAQAIVYYDFYLKLVPDAKDVGKVKRERKLAAQRAGDDVWQRPDSQTRVLETLRDALTDGRAYTQGGGGAWALYESLVRTGYVAPDLARIKQRLRKKLVDEFEGLLVSDSGQPVPILNLEEWQRQQMRLEAARSITEEPAVQKIIDRRLKIADAAIAMLNGRYDDAAKLSADALEANPDMPFVHWYRLTALAHDERYEEAREALETYREKLDEPSADEQQYLEVMEAILAHRDGDPTKASERYRKILE